MTRKTVESPGARAPSSRLHPTLRKQIVFLCVCWTGDALSKIMDRTSDLRKQGGRSGFRTPDLFGVDENRQAFRRSNPGVWMAHCHIAEHHESGMMFNFHVDPPVDPATDTAEQTR